MSVEQSSARDATMADEARLKALVQFTALNFKTPHPVPFGALIVHTQSGETLMCARNSVALENDPPVMLEALATWSTRREEEKKSNDYAA